MGTLSIFSGLCFHANKTLEIPFHKTLICNFKPRNLTFSADFLSPKSRLISNGIVSYASRSSMTTISIGTRNYEFSDGGADVELRIQLRDKNIQSSKDFFVDVDESSLTIRVQSSGSLVTLIETNCLYEKIKPAETIWYIDEDQLVVSLKKLDTDMKWPDITENWESLTAGTLQLLKGTSIYVIGDSTEINQKIAKELAVGLRYTPLSTTDLLETFAKQSIDSWVMAEGAVAVAEAEAAILESLSSHVRAVVVTLGGQYGAAGRDEKWRHLHAGFTIWLSQSEATDDVSAKEEARKHIQDGSQAYSNADVVVKLGGWDPNHSKTVAQAALSALKRLIQSDKKLPGTAVSLPSAMDELSSSKDI